MKAAGREVTIVMVEDDEGHARLIEKNVRRAGVSNELVAFTDGTRLAVQKGDFVTIKPDIKGVWTVLEPITNLYMYHDTGSPA